MESVGARIRRARLKQGLSLQSLADAIGVHLTTLWRWEHDEQEPRLSRVEDIAEALGLSRSALLGRERRKA